MIEPLYRGLTRAAAPALLAWLHWRERHGKEDAARLDERRGRARRPRPPGPLAWLHAASVGEAMSVLPLLRELRTRWPAVPILVTTGTVTSAQLLGERLPEGCFHQYVPLDVPGWVARFLDHWRPGLVLWTESEFWPNIIAGLRARGVPIALINARLSPRSFARWQAAAAFLRPPLDAFDPCLAQDETIAGRLTALGAHHVQCVGNLKFDAEPLPVDEHDLAKLRSTIGNRPAWLAASIQPAEADVIARAHIELTRTHGDLLTVVVPRHPQRGEEIAAAFARAGLAAARRSTGGSVDASTNVYIADTLGELGLFYRLTPIAFIGGSLVDHGGQNALEAARLDQAIVFGPFMHNFPEVTAALLQAGGGEQIANAAALPQAIGRLLDDPQTRTARAAAARRVADSGRGTVGRVATALAPLFERLLHPEAHRARA